MDDDGRALGTAPLVDAHTGRGRRHLAFTALVLDDEDHLVLGRRSRTKPLWPGAWDGTFASHPFEGEAMTDAVRRRSREELGVELDAELVAAFVYRVDDPGAPERGTPFAESEYCAVYLARLGEGVLDPVATEIDALRRVSVASLLEASEDVWRAHCPWLALALEALRRAPRPEPFANAFAALDDSRAGSALAAALRALVPTDEWRVAPVLQNWK